MAVIRGALGDDEREGLGQRDAGLALTAGDILNGFDGATLFNADGLQRGGAFGDSSWRSPPAMTDVAALPDLILTDTPVAAVDPHLDRAFDDIDHAIGQTPDQVPGGVSFVTTPDEDGVFRGSGAVNVIVGTNGDDTIEAIGGVKNFVFARTGDDTVTTGLGDDVVFGGPGDDVIRQDFASDTAPSAVGNNRFHGGPGDDFLVFNGNIERNETVELWGGPGDDTLGASDVQEMRIFGGEGHDVMEIGIGTVFIDGGPGGDTVIFLPGGPATIRLSLQDVLESTDGGVDFFDEASIRGQVTDSIEEIQVDAAGGDVFVVHEGFNVGIFVDHRVHGEVQLAILGMGEGVDDPSKEGSLVADLITVLGAPGEEVEVIVEPPPVA